MKYSTNLSESNAVSVSADISEITRHTIENIVFINHSEMYLKWDILFDMLQGNNLFTYHTLRKFKTIA